MKRKAAPFVRLVFALAVAVGYGNIETALAQPAANAEQRTAGRERPSRPSGYLSPDAVPDYHVFLPPPPARNSPLGKADSKIFRKTRKMAGSPRWQLAADDAVIRFGPLIDDFACALGVRIDVDSAPALRRLMQRASANLGPIIGPSKARYGRQRPFVAEHGATCVETNEAFAASGSYPSGHSAVGWLYALVLAEIDPSNTASILARGRAYGESRVVCGVHYVSDIEAGRIASTALVAALHDSSEYAADIRLAREEIAAQRSEQTSPALAQCAVEADMLETPWLGVNRSD